MNELIELAKILGGAGYEIADFHNEFYDKEPCALRFNQGIVLKIVYAGSSRPPSSSPPED